MDVLSDGDWEHKCQERKETTAGEHGTIYDSGWWMMGYSRCVMHALIWVTMVQEMLAYPTWYGFQQPLRLVASRKIGSPGQASW